MKYSHFSIEERELLQTLWWQRQSVRSIAKALKRSPSSVSRELRRNFPPEHKVYTPRLAHERALEYRKHRGRTERLKSAPIRTYVINHLKQGWSPEQVSHRMELDGIGTISHEAIYQYVYHHIHRDGWGLLKPGREDLRMYLRRHRKRRMKKGLRRSQRVFKPRGRSIEVRPAVVNDRLRIGDWESDTVESVNRRPGVNTLVERKTGYVFITRLKDRTGDATVAAITGRLKALPEHLKQTVTFDNGPENSDWQTLERRTNMEAYFAHPYASWERGTNENTNGLAREYLPKGTNFDTISDEEIQHVEYLLNNRPRKRLGWKSPLEAMSVALRS